MTVQRSQPSNKDSTMTDRSSPDTKEAIHYLGAIKVRLELLYEHSTQDARLLEHLSDEVDWIDAEIERLRSPDEAATPTERAGDYADLVREVGSQTLSNRPPEHGGES